MLISKSMAIRRQLVQSGMTDEAATKKTLSPIQRLALSRNVIVPQTMLNTDDVDINMSFFSRHGIRSMNIRSAGILPLDLKERGMHNVTDLRTFGFDALDLNDAAFCASCVSAFGAESTVRAFVINAGDAVAVAGSTAVLQLGISVEKLLEVCAGAPVQAKAVLQQTEPRGGALLNVNIGTLLDTGLRAKMMCELGYSSTSIKIQTNCNSEHLALLGF